MRCKHCNARLANHDIWCVECGRQTEVVKHDLSAMKSLSNTYRLFRPQMATAVPGTAFSLILGIIPVALLIILFNSIISIKSNTATGLLLNLFIKSISLSVFIPFVLIGFNAICKNDIDYRMGWKQITASLRSYPRYFTFSLFSAGFFYALYVVCYGFPNFASLPILRLVWLVMINYWVAIVLPAPILMERFNVDAWKAIRMSYRHFHDLRWNIYLLALVLTLVNLVAFSLLFIPMIFTLPLSLFAIRDYTMRLIDFELLDYRR